MTGCDLGHLRAQDDIPGLCILLSAPNLHVQFLERQCMRVLLLPLQAPLKEALADRKIMSDIALLFVRH